MKTMGLAKRDSVIGREVRKAALMDAGKSLEDWVSGNKSTKHGNLILGCLLVFFLTLFVLGNLDVYVVCSKVGLGWGKNKPKWIPEGSYRP